MYIELSKSPIRGKKWQVILYENKEEKKKIKTLHFGAIGYEDYTTHHDDERKERYITRHRAREDWGKSGIDTSGFWALYLLWNKKTIGASISDIENKFNVDIVKK